MVHVLVGAHLYYQGLIGQAGPVAASIGIVIGAILMILIAVSYGALVEKFPFLVGHLHLVS